MKATLKFNIEDPEDRMAHLRCVKATDMAIALFEIVYNIRKTTKARIENTKENISTYDAVDLTLEAVVEVLTEHGIDVDELIN